jgi:hypothetical protein
MLDSLLQSRDGVAVASAISALFAANPASLALT